MEESISVRREINADSQFQQFLKDFRTSFGIEPPAKISTEQKEILGASIRVDAVVSFPGNFDFTKLKERIFPWLGKLNIFEFKGKNDPLKVGQYYQYAFAELGLAFVQCLSSERDDRSTRKWLSQKGTRIYWEKLKRQGAKHLCCTTILSTRDPRGLRKGFGLKPVKEYPHLQNALYRQVLSKNKFVGDTVVYLVVLNKLKVCPINAPLLILATGRKQKEFCRWLLKDAEGLTVEEQIRYKFYLTLYDLIEDEEVATKMAKGFTWEINLDAAASVIQQMPPEKVEKLFQKVLHASSPEEAAIKLIKTEEQRKRLLELLQNGDKDDTAIS